MAGAFFIVPLAHATSTTGSDLPDRWRGYALAQITPKYEWAKPSLPAAVPTVLDRAGSMRDVTFVATLAEGAGFDLQLKLRSTLTRGVLGSDTRDPMQPTLLDDVGSPFSGSLSNTGVAGRFGEAELGVSVVLAHQRFAAPALDGFGYAADSQHSGISAIAETSHGAGLEMHASHPLLAHVDWYAAYRSRINMDSFQNYRGIYGKPGDLDIPAEARFGFEWAPTASTQLRFGVDRVMYSSVEPFVSAALPRRVLALLGDGTSPEFQWQDLDIYSLTLVHDVNPDSRWSVRYSTREQPVPTSDLLASALTQNAADFGVALSYVRNLGPGQWRMVANYAPAEYVLGAPTSVYGDAPGDGRQVEFEALWTMPF